MNPYFIGIMSGTSLDGLDAVLVRFTEDLPEVVLHHNQAWHTELKQLLLALNTPSHDELHKAAHASNILADAYAEAVHYLLQTARLSPERIAAIGCHGQTIRHRPDLGYSLQLVNAARLAELTHINVVSDFRSRDIAAGGQGAPLVPAFHRAVFYNGERHRVIINIGGISNLTSLPPHAPMLGFDCGPGNLLMDAWVKKHQGLEFDAQGHWAATGRILPELLSTLLSHPFFSLTPPKSTGRDLFNLAWLESHLTDGYETQDVQASLLELTVETIARAMEKHCRGAQEIYLCGGGASNSQLLSRLRLRLPAINIALSDELNIPAQQVEATAFAWLAKQTLEHRPGNCPEATGARGPRVLGAIYPA